MIAYGGAAVTTRGIALASHHSPTLNDNMSPGEAGTGQFSVTLEGLTEGITYNARAYAINSAGTAYGNTISFVSESTVGLDKTGPEINSLRIYPNPASTGIRIHFHAEPGTSRDLIIFDATGRIVFREELDGIIGGDYAITVDISGMPEVMYKCQLCEYERPQATGKLIIVR